MYTVNINSGNFFVPCFNTTAYGLRYVGLVICSCKSIYALEVRGRPPRLQRVVIIAIYVLAN